MELTRKDFVYLKILYKKGCTSFFHSMTLVEIMDVTKTKRASTYRNLQRLDDLEDVDEPVIPEAKKKSKRKQISFDMLQELD